LVQEDDKAPPTKVSLLAKSATERSEGDVGKLVATHAELQRKETEAAQKYKEVLGQVPSHTGTHWHVLAQTGVYWHILAHTYLHILADGRARALGSAITDRSPAGAED
jgi:hypothetical protein